MSNRSKSFLVERKDCKSRKWDEKGQGRGLDLQESFLIKMGRGVGRGMGREEGKV